MLEWESIIIFKFGPMMKQRILKINTHWLDLVLGVDFIIAKKFIIGANYQYTLTPIKTEEGLISSGDKYCIFKY